MSKIEPTYRRRTLLSFPEKDLLEDLIEEAGKKGLRLATYLKSLIITHPERARGARTR